MVFQKSIALSYYCDVFSVPLAFAATTLHLWFVSVVGIHLVMIVIYYTAQKYDENISKVTFLKFEN